MRRFSMSFRRQGNVTPEPLKTDLVKLGILMKQVSEFTTDDIGKVDVSIPYTDANGVISGPIVFEVVGVNHHTTTEHPKTITLMTKNIIRKAAFDAEEPNNNDSNRKTGGNSRWSVSNIRQWLNSPAAAGKWFTAQHTADVAPTYVSEPGFLAGFSANILQHFTDITNITALCNVDGGGSETTVDKVFLPSRTEMGYGNTNNIVEGTHLSLKYKDDNSKIKQWNESNDAYWMRTPYPVMRASYVYAVSTSPNIAYYPTANSNIGIAPIIVLH